MECDNKKKMESFLFDLISIHALTWSATRLISAYPRGLLSFQSTHSHGVRRTLTLVPADFGDISIHALTWSATYHSQREALSDTFQSMHSHGVRQWNFEVPITTKKFQSTHSHGVRPKPRNQPSYRLYFNPRTHMECDPP